MVGADGAVFAVGDEEVETGTGEQLGRDRVEERHPGAEQETVGPEPGPEVGHDRQRCVRDHTEKSSAWQVVAFGSL